MTKHSRTRRANPGDKVEKAKLLEMANDVLAAPPSTPLNPKELEIYRALGASRRLDDWLPSELIILAEAARIRVQMDWLFEVIRLLGPTDTSQKNGLAPELAAYSRLDGLFMAKCRFLKIGTTTDPKVLDRGGKAAHHAKADLRLVNSDDDDDDALLASFS